MNLIHLRQQVDGIDKSILQLIAKRFLLVQEIRPLKTAVADVHREESLHQLWKEHAATLGLSETFIAELLDIVLAESRRLQTKIA